MKIGYKNLKILAVLYAFVPIIIFYAGWLNIISAIIFIALSAAAIFFFIKNASHRDGKYKSITLSKTQIIIIAAISLIWCFMAGQGGFVHQSQDHAVRNTLFKSLISQKWPVTYDNGNTMMCYYIAHWIFPAIFGKLALFISGSARAAYIVGNVALLLWSSFGCFIVLLLVATITNTGKKPMFFIAIFMFIFFSGLDVVGVLLRKSVKTFYDTSTHLEWWCNQQTQYSSNTTCLYWVFNQCIVPWIIVLCIINETKLKNLALFAILSLPYGPFPFLGIVTICVFKAVSALCKAIKSKKIGMFFIDAFSLQNILGFLAVAPVYLLYYTANTMVASAGAAASADAAGVKTIHTGQLNLQMLAANAKTSAAKTGFRIHDKYVELFKSKNVDAIIDYAKWYAVFMILEIGLYAAVILRRVKPNIVLIGTLISLLIIPLFQFGRGSDFCMRVSIPGLVYICVTFIQVVIAEMPEWGEYGSFKNCMRHKKLLVAALIIFTIGTFTPATEIKREFLSTIATPYTEIMKHFDESGPAKGDLFAASNYKNSKFYKYFCKKSDDNK